MNITSLMERARVSDRRTSMRQLKRQRVVDSVLPILWLDAFMLGQRGMEANLWMAYTETCPLSRHRDLAIDRSILQSTPRTPRRH